MPQTAVTEDGRALSYDAAGAPKGPVVFLQQGTPCSRLIYGPQAAVAERLGLRLVSHDRPGYGGSSPLPGRHVADGASDLKAIARHLGVSRCAVWGFSGGSPHALACAALASDLVVAAVVLASIETLRSGMETSADGPFEDQWAFAHSWGFDLQTISIPVRYRHGTLDADVQPEHGDWITSRLATAEVHCPEEAHISLLLLSAEDDFPWLAAHLL